MVVVVNMATAFVCAYHTAIDHLQAIEEELHVGAFAKWDSLGLNLGLSFDRLEVIKQDERSTEGRVRAVLCDWLRKNYSVQENGLPSWKTLANAVKPIDCALARKIRDRHL